MIFKEIRIYGGYIKAAKGQACAMLPVLIYEDSKESAMKRAERECFEQFPLAQGWVSHHWDVVESIISPTGHVTLDRTDRAVHEDEFPESIDD